MIKGGSSRVHGARCRPLHLGGGIGVNLARRTWGNSLGTMGEESTVFGTASRNTQVADKAWPSGGRQGERQHVESAGRQGLPCGHLRCEPDALHPLGRGPQEFRLWSRLRSPVRIWCWRWVGASLGRAWSGPLGRGRAGMVVIPFKSWTETI